MKNSVLKTASILILFFLTSCEKDHMGDCFKSTGMIVKVSRDVSPFQNIDVNKKVDVVIRHGNQMQLEVEAGENIIDGITTRIENNTLYIDNENKCNWVRSYSNPFRVYVTLPKLVHVFQYGNGDITSDGVLPVDTLQLDVWNSGNISLQVDGDFIQSRQHVSVGDVSLSGITRELYVYNAGNGFSYMSGLHASVAQVDHRGTGNCEVHVDSLLHYDIRGIGNIYLYGNAEITGNIIGAGTFVRK